MRRICCAVQTAAILLHHYSEARSSLDGSKQAPWLSPPGEKPVYPPAASEFPHRRPRFRKTHIEWMLHHGHGDRYGKYGPSREIADFEYEDGTPSSISSRRFAFKHHQDHLVVQLIRAGATVERFEKDGLLPRIPGTPEQRDWDPEIPLFLEDLDERGRPPKPIKSMVSQAAEEHFQKESRTPSHLANPHAGERLEANTMFASYDPRAFVSDRIVADRQRPFWSRRRWALSDKFLVPVSPKPKNTIKDE